MPRRPFTSFLALLLFAPTLLLMQSPSLHADTMDAAVSRGSLRVGVAEEDFLPWIGRDKTGKLVGFEVDVAQDLARVLGVRMELVEVPFEDLLVALATERIDAILSAYSVTAERARLALFSVPYGHTDYYLLLDRKSLPESASSGDYDVAGYKIGVVEGTVGETIAARSFTKAEIVPLSDDNTTREALSQGRVNAIIAATPVPNFMMMSEPDRYAIGSDTLYTSSEAVAVRPDSLRFINFIDAWIGENQANGRLQAARRYWFDDLEWVGRLRRLRPRCRQPCPVVAPNSKG